MIVAFFLLRLDENEILAHFAPASAVLLRRRSWGPLSVAGAARRSPPAVAP